MRSFRGNVHTHKRTDGRQGGRKTLPGGVLYLSLSSVYYIHTILLSLMAEMPRNMRLISTMVGPSVNRREGDYVLDERLPDRLGRTARANTKSQTTMEGCRDEEARGIRKRD